METLDKCFENVCELDLIFHMDKVPSLPNQGHWKTKSLGGLRLPLHPHIFPLAFYFGDSPRSCFMENLSVVVWGVFC